jgi:hypothetical protein
VDEPILPEDFEMIEDGPNLRRAPTSRPKQFLPPPKTAPLAFSERPSLSSQGRSADAERKVDAAPASAAPKPPPASGGEFFLPKDFDPFAPPPPKPNLPDLSLDDPTPEFVPEPEPQRINQDFDIIEEPASAPRDGIAVVGGASDAEAADMLANQRNAPAAVEFDIADRQPRRDARREGRERRRDRARRDMINEEKRNRWAIVHWSLTVQLIALAAAVLASVTGILSTIIAIFGGAGVAAIFGIIVAGLMLIREVLALLSYGLGIPAPTKNNAWVWAMLALIFSFPAMAVYVVSAFFPPFISIPLVLTVVFMGWFCYLLYLKSVADALKINYLNDECMSLMRSLGMTLGATMMWSFTIIGYFVVVGIPRSLADLAGMAYVIGTCTLVFYLFLLIMGGACIFKFFYILSNLRLEIGWRIES